MSASRDYTGDSDSLFFMPPDVRAEALCDELQSGARPEGRMLNFCICAEVTRTIRAALVHPHPRADAARET